MAYSGARVARCHFEWLESRRLLSVSLDSGGWTVVTPSADSRLIYVSAAGGSDQNGGLTPSAPVASFSKAYSLLRSGYPDWILFKRGDVFAGQFSAFADSGRSAQEPMVITSYGDPSLPRPIIDSGTGGDAFDTGKSNRDLDLIGLDFTNSAYDPNSANFSNSASSGFNDLGASTDVLLEDCRFREFRNDITFARFYGPNVNITVRRCEILDSYSNNSGHSQGLYAEGTTNLTIGQYFRS